MVIKGFCNFLVPGPELDLDPGLPVRFLPLHPFVGAIGPGLASGAPHPHADRGQKMVVTSWASKGAMSGHLCLGDRGTHSLGTWPMLGMMAGESVF